MILPGRKKWLSLQDNYRTILPYFKKLSKHYNNIPEFMKVGFIDTRASWF